MQFHYLQQLLHLVSETIPIQCLYSTKSDIADTGLHERFEI
ncbi:protein of unknown function [Shinella sp. WSC3-e]|nr:hypothetical protein SHINE37_41921 [Rhizobiaceae bacterium]CAK7256527.1 protein of unknown function [Shinella sp. WSC3-e]